MKKIEEWCWHQEKPDFFSDYWRVWTDSICCSLKPFNIKPAEDWKTSLMECGL